MNSKDYFGTTLIERDRPMCDIAQLLNVILGGFNFKEDKYFDDEISEDVGFYVDRQNTVYVEVSESTLDGHYILTVRCVNVDAMAVGEKIGSPFISSFPVNQSAEANGYVNISQYTADYISSRTTLKCKPAWIT